MFGTAPPTKTKKKTQKGSGTIPKETAEKGLTFKQLTCGARLAVNHVNARDEGVVPGLGRMVSNLTHLAGLIYDTGYSATPATISYRQMKEDGATAMVGAARSAVSTPLATQAKIDKIPQCSYWSSSPSLSDVLQYPYCACPRPRQPARCLCGPRHASVVAAARRQP